MGFVSMSGPTSTSGIVQVLGCSVPAVKLSSWNHLYPDPRELFFPQVGSSNSGFTSSGGSSSVSMVRIQVDFGHFSLSVGLI